MKRHTLRFDDSDALKSESEKANYSWLLSPDHYHPILLDGLSHQSEAFSPRFDKPHKPRSPENALPPSRGVSTYAKNARFTAYKSTRPELFVQMNELIKTGLKRLADEEEDLKRRVSDEARPEDGSSTTIDGATSSEVEKQLKRLQVYSTSFERYIQDSTLYQGLLKNIIAEYDKTIAVLTEKLASYTVYDEKIADQEKQYTSKLSHQKEETGSTIKSLSKRVKELETDVAILTRENNRLTKDNHGLRESNYTLKKDHDTSKITCVALTANMTQLEEELYKVEAAKNDHIAKITNHQAMEVKLNEVIDKLQQELQERDSLQETLVRPELLHERDLTIARLETELRRIERTHRQLLVRYTSIKFMIDGSLRKLDERDNQDVLQKAQVQRLQSAVLELLEEHRDLQVLMERKEELRLLPPTEKMKRVIADADYPGVMLEALLDQVQNLLDERRRAQLEIRSLKCGASRSMPGSADEAEGGFRVSTAATEGGGGRGGEPPSRGGPESESALAGLFGAGVVVNEHGEVEEVLAEDTYLESQGEGPNVPCYLRYPAGKQIRNLRIGEKKLLVLLNEVWEAKQQHEAQGPTPEALLQMETRQATGVATGLGALDSDDLFGSLHLVSGEQDGEREVGALPWKAAGLPGGGSVAVLEGVSASASTSARDSNYVPLLARLPNNAPLSDFLEAYLKDKVKSSSAGVELAYNIVNAARRFAVMSDCRLFLGVLEGSLSSEAWKDMRASMEAIRAAVWKDNAVYSRSSNSSESRLTQDKFMKALRKAAPLKGSLHTAALVTLLARETQESRFVDIQGLLYLGEPGCIPPFLELLQSQYITEYLDFQTEVLRAVDQHAEVEFNEVTLKKAREALKEADPFRNRAEMNRWLAAGAACPVEEMLIKEAKRLPLALDQFKTNLTAILLKKTPQPPQKKGKK